MGLRALRRSPLSDIYFPLIFDDEYGSKWPWVITLDQIFPSVGNSGEFLEAVTAAGLGRGTGSRLTWRGTWRKLFKHEDNVRTDTAGERWHNTQVHWINFAESHDASTGAQKWAALPQECASKRIGLKQRDRLRADLQKFIVALPKDLDADLAAQRDEAMRSWEGAVENMAEAAGVRPTATASSASEAVRGVELAEFDAELFDVTVEWRNWKGRDEVDVYTFKHKSNGKTVVFVRLPISDKDAVPGERQQRRQADCLARVMDRMHMSTPALTRLLRRRKDVFAEAAARARLLTSQTLTLDATIELFNATNLSWSASRRLRAILKKNGITLKLASELEIKRALAKDNIAGSFFELMLECGSKAHARALRCLAVTRSIPHTIERDLDRAVSENAFDPDWKEKDRIVIKLMGDGGGGEVSFGIQLAQIKEPCSVNWFSAIASIEMYRRIGGDGVMGNATPNESYENISTVTSLIDGFYDMDKFSVIEIGGRHIVVATSAL